MSSPRMNNIIIVGCMVTYSSVIALGINSEILNHDLSKQAICSIRAGLLSIGFSLAFGAMFSKTWRVNAIFTNITATNKKVIKDYQLQAMVSGLLAIDLIILTLWLIIDPMKLKKRHKFTDEYSESNISVKYYIEYCESSMQSTWLGITYAYKGLLLDIALTYIVLAKTIHVYGIGILLAWRTRHVSIPALNDSKYIGISVYNVVLFCLSGFMISVTLSDQPNKAYYVISTFILLSTSATIAVLFVPKLLAIRRDPQGKSNRVRATIKKVTKTQDRPLGSSVRLKKLTAENRELKAILNELKLTVIQNEAHIPDENATMSFQFLHDTIATSNSLLLKPELNFTNTYIGDNSIPEDFNYDANENKQNGTACFISNDPLSTMSFTLSNNPPESSKVRIHFDSASLSSIQSSTSSYEDRSLLRPSKVQMSIPSPFQPSHTGINHYFPASKSPIKCVFTLSKLSSNVARRSPSRRNKGTFLCDVLEYI